MGDRHRPHERTDGGYEGRGSRVAAGADPSDAGGGTSGSETPASGGETPANAGRPGAADATRVSRRGLLFGTGIGVIAGAAAGIGGALTVGAVADPEGPEGTPVAASGVHQAGVARPALPQAHCLVAVADLDRAALTQTLDALTREIRALTAGERPEVTLDGPGDLTVTVGLGARAVAALDPALADTVVLPAFAGDDALDPAMRGGDILLSVNATDPIVLEPVLRHLQRVVGGWRLRWSEFGYQGTRDGNVGRNPFGYHDGIAVPRGAADLDANVWISEGPLAGGTVCVIRRFQLDTAAFGALPLEEQDAAIGRHRQDGSPLSGGSRDDDVDLSAKSPDGTPLIPPHAHARAAHPSFTGSDLMLRRSYSYRASAIDHGHLFISFQRDIATFSRTQLRLDETDALMAFATPTATAAFAILPGFTGSRSLGLRG